MTIAYWRKKADKAYQEWGRMTYKKCLVCSKPMSCLHHYYPKSTSSNLRYNKNNGIPLCAGCHLKHHCGNPSIQNKINDKMGKVWLNNLMLKKNIIIKPTVKYYKNIIEKYAQKDNR